MSLALKANFAAEDVLSGGQSGKAFCTVPMDKGVCEIQVANIYKGYKPKDAADLLNADVVVDRSGKKIVLALISVEPIRWNINSGGSTSIDQVLLGGDGARKSKVYLNGAVIAPIVRDDLPYYHHENRKMGPAFSDLVNALCKSYGVDRINYALRQFSAKAGQPIVLNKSSDDVKFTTDQRAGEGGAVLAAEKGSEADKVIDIYSNEEGNGVVILRKSMRSQVIPMGEGVPAIEDRLSGAAFDAKRDRAYLVTSGVSEVPEDSAGRIYAADIKSNVVNILHTLSDFEATSIFVDQKLDRLIVGGVSTKDEVFRPGLYILSLADGSVETVVFDPRGLPSYTESYNIGEGSDGIPPGLVIQEADGHNFLVYTRVSPVSFTHIKKTLSYRLDALNKTGVLVVPKQ